MHISSRYTISTTNGARMAMIIERGTSCDQQNIYLGRMPSLLNNGYKLSLCHAVHVDPCSIDIIYFEVITRLTSSCRCT